MSFQLPECSGLPKYTVIAGDTRREQGSGERWAHIYPANGQVTAELTLAGVDDVAAAVETARAAFPGWRATSGDKRRNMMLKLADLLQQNAAELSALSTLENGSPAMAAAHMPHVAAERFRFYAGWTDKIKGETLSGWYGPAHNYVDYEPYGVVGAIIPWNGPLFAAAMVLSPALAAGNCIVLKAPELAPYAVMRMAELFDEAGFPPGVVNMVAGGPDVGEAIVAHPGVDKVQFVGSGATAKKVLTTAAQTLKPCGLELGGKSAVIVFDDADLKEVGPKGLTGAISVSGQGCVNGTRLLVHRPIYEQYLDILKTTATHIKMGDPADPATIMGPVISEASAQRIEGIVDRALSEGARRVLGGGRLDGEFADGFYVPLTILADVDPASDLARHEVFGPVLSVTPFDTEEDAIAIANSTDYGLGAYIYTQNLRRGHHVAGQMQAGMVHVNGSGEGMQPYAPFGGMKQSGYGRLGGEQGLMEFLQARNVWVSLAPPQQ